MRGHGCQQYQEHAAVVACRLTRAVVGRGVARDGGACDGATHPGSGRSGAVATDCDSDNEQPATVATAAVDGGAPSCGATTLTRREPESYGPATVAAGSASMGDRGSHRCGAADVRRRRSRRPRVTAVPKRRTPTTSVLSGCHRRGVDRLCRHLAVRCGYYSSHSGGRWRARSLQDSCSPLDLRSTIARCLPKSRLALLIVSRSSPGFCIRMAIASQEHSAFSAFSLLG